MVLVLITYADKGNFWRKMFLLKVCAKVKDLYSVLPFPGISSTWSVFQWVSAYFLLHNSLTLCCEQWMPVKRAKPYPSRLAYLNLENTCQRYTSSYLEFFFLKLKNNTLIFLILVHYFGPECCKFLSFKVSDQWDVKMIIPSKCITS